jgi:hypothetical protein
MSEQASAILGSVAWKVLRRCLARWLLYDGLLLTALVLAFLVLRPQGYSSRISFSFQQGPTASSVISLATISSSYARYIGFVKSRRFAEEVAESVGLREKYRLPNDFEATELLLEGVSVTDNAREGILVMEITLPGPPRLALNWSGPSRTEVADMAAKAGNQFGVVLQRFLEENDVERDSVLNRTASIEVKKVRLSYEQAADRFQRFLIESRVDGPGSQSAVASSSQEGGAESGPQLASLYLQQAALEADIRQAETTLKLTKQTLEDQLRDPLRLPSEDPLLAQARAAVRERRLRLDALLIQFGGLHPQVRVAREELTLSERELDRQRAAVLSGRTTSRLDAETRLEGLRTRLGEVNRQVEEYEANLRDSLKRGGQLERLRGELTLRLETLKAASSMAATIAIQTVSGKNRMVVVDKAIAPKRGSPGIVLTTAVCLFPVLLILVAQFSIAYSAETRRSDAVAPA